LEPEGPAEYALGGDLETDKGGCAYPCVCAESSLLDLDDAELEVDREMEDKLESRWWFLTRVGRKGRSSADRKPDESKDSSSSS
jgi:hypothetical protein